MRTLQVVYFKAIMRALPVPAALGQIATTAGDYTLETSAKLYMAALRRLASLESEGR